MLGDLLLVAAKAAHGAKGAPLPPLQAFLANPAAKALIPTPILIAIAPVVWLFFRRTWLELDREAQKERGALLDEGRLDYRPAVAFVTAAVVLTLQQYYGGHKAFNAHLRPILAKLTAEGWDFLYYKQFFHLYGHGWWAFTRCFGYVVIPFTVWKLCFPRDSLLDMGLRLMGFKEHLWIYGVCLGVVIPAMFLVARQPDFARYYPFYKQASRSWFDLLLWECMYFLQFLSLELFFRGWWLRSMGKSLGSGAIFAMAVPYCMIHFHKPYFEVNGAIIAGIVLGSLSMRTKSIYAGFLVHITVALSMDLLALTHRNALPQVFWPPGF